MEHEIIVTRFSQCFKDNQIIYIFFLLKLASSLTSSFELYLSLSITLAVRNFKKFADIQQELNEILRNDQKPQL